MKSGAWEGKLDVYWRSDPGPHPTLIWIHGGGPTGGSREAALFYLLPYLERGWNVVNVEHRLAGVTLAPAALQNSLCAVRWVVQNAKSFNSDSARLVISGDSSGGWFAVAAGLGVRPPGWDQACPGPEEPKVAAVVNWYGNWDLADILDGPNKKPYAAGWVANLPDGVEVARSMLPLPLRPNVPPVISVHGDDDGTVPYTQSVRLHEALKQAGIPQQLVTIPGGKHGGFSRDESRRAFAAIDAFLDRVGLRPQPSKQQ
jgi:acetyl esterase/lipase